MKTLRIAFLAFILVSFLPHAQAQAQSQTYSETIITPHIGEGWENVQMRFTVEGDKFTTYIVADALYNLIVKDAQGGLGYEIGNPILFGKRRYVPMTVGLRGGKTEFEISFDRDTLSTGTVISGEYWYYLKRTTDVAVVEYRIPLDGIYIKSDSEPAPVSVRHGNPTIVTYRITEGDVVKITTRYMRNDGIDYTKTKTSEEKVRVAGKEYAFLIKYPEDAEPLAEDVRFFVYDMFPRLIEETGYPLKTSAFTINLKEKGDQEWWAAVNRGGGTIEFFIETPHTYPSTILSHELIHSYIRGVPTFINEGLANFFEGKVLSHFTPDLGIPSYAPREWYWQTYEKQYDEFVDIKTDYGESGNDKLESLISAKYDKGTYLMALIAKRTGDETVREMLHIIAKKSEGTLRSISLDYIVSDLGKNRREVYDILTDPTFGFSLSDPRKEEALQAFLGMRNDSWWSGLLAMLYDYEGRIRTAKWDETELLKEEIEARRDFAKKTLLWADIFVVIFLFAGGTLAASSFVTMSRRHADALREKERKENLNLMKLRLIHRYGTMYGYQARMAERFGWENVENEDCMRKFAEESGMQSEVT